MWKELFFYISQLVISFTGQPLASQREPNVHKELLASTAKDMEMHLNAVQGKERNILNGAQAKLQQTNLMQVVQV